LEFALITPMFMAIAFMVVQGGLYWEAQNVVDSIATDTGRVVRTYSSYPGLDSDALPTQSQMQTVASQNVTQLAQDPHGINAGKLVSAVQAGSVSPPSWNAIQVTVKARAISVLGFVSLPRISQTVTGPYEGFRPQDVGP
jgi:Flp pilus assembly protein TadG